MRISKATLRARKRLNFCIIEFIVVPERISWDVFGEMTNVREVSNQ